MHPAMKKGAVAVVTGAASGIGFALARRLAEIGMRVVPVDLPGERQHWELSPRKLAAAGISEAQVEEAAEDANERFARLRTSLR